VFRIAAVNVAFARAGGAAGVGEVLVEVIAEVSAPNEMTAEVAMREADDVDGFIGEKRERNDEALVALAAGEGAFHQTLAKQVEVAIIAGASELHPRVEAEQGVAGRIFEFRGAEIARREDRRRSGKSHVQSLTVR